jgi:hypothetical protein
VDPGVTYSAATCPPEGSHPEATAMFWVCENGLFEGTFRTNDPCPQSGPEAGTTWKSRLPESEKLASFEKVTETGTTVEPLPPLGVPTRTERLANGAPHDFSVAMSIEIANRYPYVAFPQTCHCRYWFSVRREAPPPVRGKYSSTGIDWFDPAGMSVGPTVEATRTSPVVFRIRKWRANCWIGKNPEFGNVNDVEIATVPFESIVVDEFPTPGDDFTTSTAE